MTARAPNPLLEAHQLLRRGPVSADGWNQLVARDRRWESLYRDRWRRSEVRF